MDFIVTCIGEPHATVLKLLPGHEWVAEQVSMKYFTKDNIKRLGLLIEDEKPKWALS